MVGAQIVWLDGEGAEEGQRVAEVGERAAALARLLAHGLPVPRTFVLGRSLLLDFTSEARRDAQQAPVKLPAEVHREIVGALRGLGGSFAIRRSPFAPRERATTDSSWLTTTMGGRPERETYLHLTDAAEVSEAVRRIWGSGMTTSPPPAQVAIMVQRFILGDVCAAVRRDRADPDVLHVMSSLGVGDLLAAGLVVPDRHTLRRRDGSVLGCALGRKAQMTVPRPDGGVVRVPVPAQSARQLACDDAKVAELHATWRAAEKVLPDLAGLAMSWCAGRWYVTTAVTRKPVVQEEILLG